MGRDVAGFRIDKKPGSVNLKPNGTAPKDAPESVDTKDYALEDHTSKGIKSTNHDPQEKKLDEPQYSTDEMLSSTVKPESGSAVSGSNNSNSFETQAPSPEVENNESGEKCSPKSNDLDSPRDAKKSQTNFPFMSRKQLQPRDTKFYDEDDNWSLASSTATSRTIKSQVTVAVAPSFVCVDRAERRKQFYSKLEEKHKALEQEKLEYEARTKEEELAAIKQLRKSMTYKANPVPNFYREGPPTKAELKKLPVTRAKSPNLTRRKSFGDAVKSSPVEKGFSGRATRHSVGVYKEGKNSPTTTKIKERIGVRKSNGTGKSKDHPQQLKGTVENSLAKELGRANISVES
ncbi:protein WVD2-like 2 [Henckelia pumila]|uniref:protein WVD2-like 2 n=1 Tax=Henckelia pumila TaxID=405737 RepID=UPI003C6E350C